MLRAFYPFVSALAFVAAVASAQAAALQALTVSAAQIVLHADRGLLVADGGVTVRLPHRTISATRASYDVRTNRLAFSGSVTVTAQGVVTSGGGYVYDVATKQGFMRSSGGLVPQLSTDNALAIGQQVQIDPAHTITFTNAQVRVGSALQAAASYTYDIPPPNSKSFGFSPVPSAGFEYPFRLGLSRDFFTFATVRYDKYFGGPGFGVEEHYANTDRGWLAFGQTLDSDGGRLDLGAYQNLGKNVTQTLNALHSRGYGYARYALLQSGPRGFATLSLAQSNAWNTSDLDLSTIAHSAGKLGTYRFEADLGGDMHPGDYPVAYDARGMLALHVLSSTLGVRGAQIAASYDLFQTAYDYGRNRTTSTIALTLARGVARYLTFNGGISFSQNDDRFPVETLPTGVQNPCQTQGASSLVCFVPPPGESTYRTYSGALTYTPRPKLALYLGLQYAHDFPQYAGFGRPEFAAAFNARFVRKDGRGLEIGGILPFGGVGNFHNATVFNVSLIR